MRSHGSQGIPIEAAKDIVKHLKDVPKDVPPTDDCGKTARPSLSAPFAERANAPMAAACRIIGCASAREKAISAPGPTSTR